MSAATAQTPTATSAPPTRRFIKRPDNKLYDEKVKSIRSQINEKQSAIDKLSQQLNTVKIADPVLEERKTLRKELGELVAKRATIKQQRDAIQTQIKSIDTVLKRKTTDLNLQTSKNNFKSVEDIDKKIAQLDALIDSGSLKIVEEKKTIKEISNLRKLKKDFSQFENLQKSIDEDKLKIAELKKSLSSIQNKELQTKFDQISKRLDEINLDNTSISSKRTEIYNKRNALIKDKDELYGTLRKLKQDIDLEYAKFKKSMDEERVRRAQEEKLTKLNKEKEELVKDAEIQLSNAKIPAFTLEIDSIYNLLQHFDPTFERPQTSILPTSSSSISATKTKRTVELPDNALIIKKEPVAFFSGSKSKKNKKSNGASAPKPAKFSIEPSIIVALSELGLALPSTQEDTEATKKLLFEKLDEFKSKQDEQTKINIEKAELNMKAVEEKVLKLEKKILGEDAKAKEEEETEKEEAKEEESN